MSIADQMGFGPKYQYAKLDDGNYILRVTPGKLAGNLPPADLKVTAEEYERFNKWRNEGMLIQDAFPDWPREKCEILMTGITPDAWNKIFPPEKE